MRETLPARGWPENVLALVSHFNAAHQICYENRNKIIHSNLSVGPRQAILLYKANRDGKTVLDNPPLSELRRGADDMHIYFWFGLQLANMINIEFEGVKPKAGDRAYFAWPDKPPLPIPMEYTSDPRPIRGL